MALTPAETAAAITRVEIAVKAGKTPDAADLAATDRMSKTSGSEGDRAGRAMGDKKRGTWGILGS